MRHISVIRWLAPKKKIYFVVPYSLVGWKCATKMAWCSCSTIKIQHKAFYRIHTHTHNCLNETIFFLIFCLILFMGKLVWAHIHTQTLTRSRATCCGYFTANSIETRKKTYESGKQQIIKRPIVRGRNKRSKKMDFETWLTDMRALVIFYFSSQRV